MDEISQPIISKIEKLVIEEKETPQIIELKKYLNKQLKISLSDGRILQGKFWCVDNRKNLVIGEAVESRQISFQQESGSSMKESKRSLGTVIIPGKHIVKCEAEDS